MDRMPGMTERRAIIDSPVGPLTLLADDVGLSHVLFDRDQDVTDQADTPNEGLVDRPDDPVLRMAAGQLAEYFAGERTTFDLPLHPSGNDFELAVWQVLSTIPYGKTMSYGRQAELIGRPGAARAVGAANGRNPLSIVVPCHRVVGADGSLTGFGGGIDRKLTLLELETGVQRLPL